MRAPRLARGLLRLVAPADRRDDTLGDLEEAHRARHASGRMRAWAGTIAEALVIAATLAWARIRDARPFSARWAGWSDVRLGVRLMHRQPVLTLTAVISLTVGIGVATVGFAFMEALLFSRLPYENGARFVRILTFEQPERRAARLPAEAFGLIASQATMLEHLGALEGGRENVVAPNGDVETLTTAGLSPSSLAHLPVVPLAGRLLSPADGEPGAPPVAMVRARYVGRSLAGVADPIGATIEVAGIPRTVVGIVDDGFEFPNSPDVWLPIGEGFREGRTGLPGGAGLFGILAEGRTAAAAQDQLAPIAPALHPLDDPRQAIGIEVSRFTDLGRQGADLATAAVVAVLAVLLVIAANVGNLILARSFGRHREFSLRAALGASRRRIVTQVFVEVLLLGGVAAVLGSLTGDAALRAFNRMDGLPFWVDFTAGPRATGLVVAATLLAAVVAGAWPALRATRRDLAAGLRGGDGRSSDLRFGRTAGAMVVVQIAMSVTLLHGALILAQGFTDYARVELDLPPNVLTAYVSVNATRPGAPAGARVTLTAGDVERIAAAVPGAMAAAFATALPRHSPRPAPVEIEAAGNPADGATASPVLMPFAEVSRGYFDVLDAPVLAGRGFVDADYLAGAPPVAVVNAPFVDRVLGGVSPIGRRIRTADGDARGPWRTIVGVVPDLGLSVGDETLAAGFYTPLSRTTNVGYLAMRVAGDALASANPLRRALIAEDPGFIVSRPERLEDVGWEDRVFFKWGAVALVGLGVLTLGLALAGVYAMMSLLVARRTREIGIRLALGATTTRVARSVVGRAAWQVGLGGLAGCGLAVLSLDLRASLASRLGDGGAWTLPLVAGLLVLAGLVATWVPLRRALGVRPGEALRAE